MVGGPFKEIHHKVLPLVLKHNILLFSILAAQWPQQQLWKHTGWSDDPQETPKLDRCP